MVVVLVKLRKKLLEQKKSKLGKSFSRRRSLAALPWLGEFFATKAIDVAASEAEAATSLLFPFEGRIHL